ncbi:MAG: histidine phosphatase family protein [Patescibacteria group bacterium]
MEIYFVRHGETGGNVAHRHQVEHTPLTPEGIVQAHHTAEVVKAYEPTHLLSSTLVRALETARIIGEVCDLVPETSPTFIELMRPDDLYGYHHFSPQSLWFYVRWYYGQSKGGESYEAVRKRINEAKSHLATYKEDARIAVVSHSVFINLFLAHLCDDDPLTVFDAARVFTDILRMKNASVVPLLFDSRTHTGTCNWLRE